MEKCRTIKTVYHRQWKYQKQIQKLSQRWRSESSQNRHQNSQNYGSHALLWSHSRTPQEKHHFLGRLSSRNRLSAREFGDRSSFSDKISIFGQFVGGDLELE